MGSGKSWSIQVKNSARKELLRVAGADRQRLSLAIDGLVKNPYRGSVLKGGFRGLRRIRVGNYRILYEVRDQELIVLVVRVAHRRQVYR